MKRTNLIANLLVSAVVMLMLAACGSPAPTPTPTTSLAPELPAADAPATTPDGGDGGGVDGIQVHGDWVIEVREPDGTLVSHDEFSNALNDGGAAAIASLLGRVNTAGKWLVTATGLGSSAGPCLNSNGSAAWCTLVEDATSAFPNQFSGLTVTVPGFGEPNEHSLVLSGMFTVGNATDVTRVFTNFMLCDPSNAPSVTSPCSGGSVSFSSKDLDDPVAVQVGQSVSLTVIFSFS